MTISPSPKLRRILSNTDSASVLQKTVGWLLLISLILVVTLGPFLAFEVQFEVWLATALDTVHTHPWLLATLLVTVLAADCVLPVPSSLVSVFAGAAFGWAIGAVVIWIGMCCGCLIAYLLGASGGRFLALPLLGEAELARARRLFTEVGPAALVITRAVPVLAEAGALAAGMVRMPLRPFIVATTIANALVAFAFAVTGMAAVSGSSFLWVFFGLVVLPAIGWALWRIFIKRRHRQFPE
jgi:uncharacterized membrane protein YdjX (TVP38/TMEM64 family)